MVDFDKESAKKRTIVFDFDGVIHSYESGWKGLTNITDPPVPGIKEAINQIIDAGYSIAVVSSRTATGEGRRAVSKYLLDNGFPMDKIEICSEKPPALVYIDDRAICFDGNPETLLSKIVHFKPWNR